MNKNRNIAAQNLSHRRQDEMISITNQIQLSHRNAAVVNSVVVHETKQIDNQASSAAPKSGEVKPGARFRQSSMNLDQINGLLLPAVPSSNL